MLYLGFHKKKIQMFILKENPTDRAKCLRPMQVWAFNLIIIENLHLLTNQNYF